MKKKRKIIIGVIVGIVVFFFIFVFLSFFMMSPTMVPSPNGTSISKAYISEQCG